jgi:hypothetical protein
MLGDDGRKGLQRRPTFAILGNVPTTKNVRQGVIDLFDDVPLSLADDPEIELGDLLTVPVVERPTCPTCGLITDDRYAFAPHECPVVERPAGYVWPYGQAGVDSKAMR